MVIKQNEMDDAVLQVRIRSLLGHIAGLLQDRPLRELPSELQKVKRFTSDVLEQPLFPGVKSGRESAVHTFVLLEVLSKEPIAPVMFLDEIIDACDSGSFSGDYRMSPAMAVPLPVVHELLLEHGSPTDLLDNEE